MYNRLMTKKNLINIFEKAGWGNSSAYSLVNGNRKLFNTKQITLLKKIEQGELVLKEVISIAEGTYEFLDTAKCNIDKKPKEET